MRECGVPVSRQAGGRTLLNAAHLYLNRQSFAAGIDEFASFGIRLIFRRPLAGLPRPKFLMDRARPLVAAGAAALMNGDMRNRFLPHVDHRVIEFGQLFGGVIHIVADESPAGSVFCPVGAGSMNHGTAEKKGLPAPNRQRQWLCLAGELGDVAVSVVQPPLGFVFRTKNPKMLRAGNEVKAAVLEIGVIDRRPGGDAGRWAGQQIEVILVALSPSGYRGKILRARRKK